MQGPSSDAEKGTRSPGSQGRIPTREGASQLVPAACPATEHRGQGLPCPSERLLLLLLLAGTASALTPSTARPQPGPGGETEARGRGRAALTPGTHRSLLVPPAAFLPSARALVWQSLVTRHCHHCPLPPHHLPLSLPTSRHCQSVQDLSTHHIPEGPLACAGQEPVPAGQHRGGDQELDQVRSRRRVWAGHGQPHKTRTGEARTDTERTDRQTDRELPYLQSSAIERREEQLERTTVT